jgi:Immunoglobulin-like domain of bacterial spore germination
MTTTRILPAVFAAAALLVACGDDGSEADVAQTTATTVAPTTTAGPDVTTTSGAGGLEQPAIWPAPDVVFETPEAAAADFVTQVLGVESVLGEFLQGDARSGEIEVLFPGEGGGATPTARGLLLLRRRGSGDGWFILSAANEHASITSPESMAVVPAGTLRVEGSARGFEANVVVTAFVAGDADDVLDSTFTQAGTLETAGPFSVTLDLSGAAPGAVVVLMVQGGAGLETDPGDFGAIPIVVAG